MTMLVDEQRLMREVGTDLVVGSAPPEKAGSASAMTETVQESRHFARHRRARQHLDCDLSPFD
ncbi:MFS transporter [Ensifer sp. ENS12]|uniref:MFS transporter n=1 Tax=Ensifer sp. ENS12 TaxID=2854774 RepID=UPI0013B00452|nr:MFS transporter [Ensifer sp. ENS12]MBV7516609.1 hypothetical protein [Ensifer sp. ENS12]